MMATVRSRSIDRRSCSTEARKPWLSKLERPQRGQLTMRMPRFLSPSVLSSSTPACTSVSIGPVIEIRSVLPIPSLRSCPRAHVERTTEETTEPASVTPRWRG